MTKQTIRWWARAITIILLSLLSLGGFGAVRFLALAAQPIHATNPLPDQLSPPTTVTVQPGDTLFRIAVEYGVTVDALVAANHLADASQIQAGQVLIIPQPTSSGTNAAAPVYPIPYTVQQGDTLYSIATRFGVTPEALAAANGISDPNLIYVGQALTVPGNQPPAGQTVAPAVTSAPTATLLPSATLPPIILTASNTPIVTNPTPVTASPAPVLIVPSATTTNVPFATHVPATVTRVPSSTIPVTSTPSVTTIPATATLAPTVVLRTYTVQPGDQLSQIAALYGVDYNDIATLNGLSDPNLIYSGLVLKIPPSSVNPPPTPIEEPPPLSNPITLVGGDVSGKQIVVVLHEQRVYIYQDSVLIKDVSVSTGLPGTPTVIGHFHIYQMLTSQLMVGPGYYLPDVPWVMYFYEGYGLHGTYWHHNWGHPMSHGCVNMPTDEAAWLYNWSSVGTPVTVLA